MPDVLNRVVVTGMGILSPLGMDATTTWEGLASGKSGVDYITLFDTEPLETKFGGEVKGFCATDFISRKEARHMDRFAQLAVAASREAMEQSRLQINSANQNDVGIILGSGIGGLTTLFEQMQVLLERGPRRVSPFLVPMMITDMAASQVSISLGLKGPNLCTTSACSSGSDAIGAAYEMIKHGDTQAMLAGGSESVMNQICFAAFNALKALSTRNSEPKLASRPFDAERDGFVISEGTAVLVLESLFHAQERQANILAEIISYGASADAFHVTQPDGNGEGAARAIQIALNKAGISATEIDYINAHGTSTQLNDAVETKAIKTVFGENAYSIPISSTKSMLGHMIGGAGAIEAAICIMVIQNALIPPTINLTNPDPECNLDYVPNVARRTKVTTALSNSFGFGGHNSTLIFRQYCEA
ncbi:MAG: beta-ketoacyl-[acyl-carrier-protein] synthase II [Dehalococcoidales bacterium]|nr:beta-ketoacyl-[acyl-carrier-protein] synthase II [Dehalococcoidales bacterium]